MNINPAEQLRNFLESHRTARNIVLKKAYLKAGQLSGLRADNLDLEEADLRESSLIAVKWKVCNLRDTRLDGTDFTDAVLRLCNLVQARATDAFFLRTRLENCTARGARFDGADMTGAVLTDTDFSRASFHGTNMEGVSASGANFRGADLTEANLRDAELTDTDLRGADLTGAELQGVDLHGADLRGAIGIDEAFQKEDRHRALPPEMGDLVETMTPVVIEVLQTAGRSGYVDPDAAERLINDTLRHGSPSPRNAPSPDTLKAISQVIGEFEGDVLPALIGALGQPNGGEPPPKIKALILRLRETLGLDETASMEDVLSRLTGGVGGPPKGR